MELSSTHIKSNDVRLPQPKAGEALVVDRYSSDRAKAVILHPDDFAQLKASAEALEEATTSEAPGLSELAERAHRIVESPEGELVTDEAAVKRLLEF